MAKCVINSCGNIAVRNGRCYEHRLGVITKPGITNRKSTFIVLVEDSCTYEVAVDYKTYSALKREISQDNISSRVSKRRVRGGYKLNKTFKINATGIEKFNIKRYAD